MTKDALWFTTGRVSVSLSKQDNAPGLSLLEHILPGGFSPPLHVHHDEAETFYVIEGRFRFVMDGQAVEAGPGETVHAPAGSVHSFVVLSPEGGRCLTITQGGFEQMVREMSRPAANDGLPEQRQPTPAEQQALAVACRRNGIDLLGAPLAA